MYDVNPDPLTETLSSVILTRIRFKLLFYHNRLMVESWLKRLHPTPLSDTFPRSDAKEVNAVDVLSLKSNHAICSRCEKRDERSKNSERFVFGPMLLT